MNSTELGQRSGLHGSEYHIERAGSLLRYAFHVSRTLY